MYGSGIDAGGGLALTAGAATLGWQFAAAVVALLVGSALLRTAWLRRRPHED